MTNDVPPPGGVGGPPAQTSSRRGWHYRGYLPHFDAPGFWQSITYRLVDALPVAVVRKLAEELGITDARAGRPRPQGKAPATDVPDDERRRAYRKKVEAWLDAGMAPVISAVHAWQRSSKRTCFITLVNDITWGPGW